VVIDKVLVHRSISTLDVLVIDGEIKPAERISELGLRATRENDKEARLVGAIKGGGPTITVRATRGNLELMSRDEKAQREKADAGPEK